MKWKHKIYKNSKFVGECVEWVTDGDVWHACVRFYTCERWRTKEKKIHPKNSTRSYTLTHIYWREYNCPSRVRDTGSYYGPSHTHIPIRTFILCQNHPFGTVFHACTNTFASQIRHTHPPTHTHARSQRTVFFPIFFFASYRFRA